MTSGRGTRREAFFLDPRDEGLFAVATYPKSRPVGGLLYVHPFAEEMNKSRRMASLAAQSFAEHGWLVLQIDLSGCGDSRGDFGDADWQRWIDDVESGWEWLAENCQTLLGLWTLRSGSLLAADWVARGRSRPPLILWQPVGSGEKHLIQFLRLKAANEMLSATENRGIVASLRDDISADRPIEVAGYRLSPGLAKGLQLARLQLPKAYPAQVSVIEVTSGERRELSPATKSLVDSMTEAGADASAHVVGGPSFWQTQEIETAPELISASVEALGRLLK